MSCLARRSVVLIDGPNIDMNLGGNILKRRPCSNERPQWDRFRAKMQAEIGDVDCYFFLNGNRFDFNVTPFYRFLSQSGYTVLTPQDTEKADPVDDAIVDMMDRIENPGHIVLVSHDGVYADPLRRVLERGGQVTIVGFLEWLDTKLVDLQSDAVRYLDVEHHLRLFKVPLLRPCLVQQGLSG